MHSAPPLVLSTVLSILDLLYNSSTLSGAGALSGQVYSHEPGDRAIHGRLFSDHGILCLVWPRRHDLRERVAAELI
jgi:hypothetical protein